MKVICGTWQTARKAHICDFCGYKILPGQRYLRDFLEDDGAVYTWKSHSPCFQLSQEQAYYYGGTPPFSEWDWDDMVERHFAPCRERYWALCAGAAEYGFAR